MMRSSATYTASRRGSPTWDGQSLTTCERQINEWGLSAFLCESQHEIVQKGGIWDHIEFRHCKPDELPDFVRGCVWCDPAVTDTDDSCSNGIIADAIDEKGTMYRLYSWEAVDSATEDYSALYPHCSTIRPGYGRHRDQPGRRFVGSGLPQHHHRIADRGERQH